MVPPVPAALPSRYTFVAPNPKSPSTPHRHSVNYCLNRLAAKSPILHEKKDEKLGHPEDNVPHFSRRFSYNLSGNLCMFYLGAIMHGLNTIFTKPRPFEFRPTPLPLPKYGNFLLNTNRGLIVALHFDMENGNSCMLFVKIGDQLVEYSGGCEWKISTEGQGLELVLDHTLQGMRFFHKNQVLSVSLADSESREDELVLPASHSLTVPMSRITIYEMAGRFPAVRAILRRGQPLRGESEFRDQDHFPEEDVRKAK